jgi:GTP-binding protein YchF
MKPVIYVANVSEDEVSAEPLDNADYVALKEQAAREHSQIIAICAQLEAEIAELDDDEKQMFLDDLGIAESGLDRLIKASYSLLGLISYLTAGQQEVRAWTITKGTKAPQAAGKIHSDFERGFIRAEIVSFEDLERLGSMNAVKEAGLYRSEGKEYVMRDGDIVLFRFNV